MEKPKDWYYVKATDRESGPPRYSFNWIIAGRTLFKVYSDRIKIGRREILFSDIENITLYQTKQMIFSAELLSIKTKEKEFQVGFNPWVNPVKYIPLNINYEKVKMQYSVFSIVYRIALIAFLIYWFFIN